MEGNVSINQSIGATNSISAKGNSLNANNAVIYSENGNIDLNFNYTTIDETMPIHIWKICIRLCRN